MKKNIVVMILAFVWICFPLSSQSRGLEVVAKSLGGEHAVVGKQYAVFIAIDSYKEWMPLKNPVKDAREIRDILTSRYYVDQVLELYNVEATKEGILRLFDTLIKAVKPEDSVLIYYAGHGQLDTTDTGFWIPVDAGTDRFRQENWIPNIQVRNNIGKMQARHIALLSDSCFSGDILNPTRGATPAMDPSYFGKAWTRVSRQVLTSGASESVPDQSEFSQQLKLVLRGNTQPYLDPLMIYGQIRLGMTRTTPLFGDLKDSGHQEGASYLLFLKDPPRDPGPATAANASIVPGDSRKAALGAERGRASILVASSEKEVSVYIDGEPKGPLGSGLFRELSAGDVNLELKGDGLYFQGKVGLRDDETAQVNAEPVAVGIIAVETPGASVSVTGPNGFYKTLSGSGKLENVPVAPSYSVRASDIGYGIVTRKLAVERGQTATFRLEAPGRVAVLGIPSNVEEIRYGSSSARVSGRDSVVLENLAPGEPLAIKLFLGGSRLGGAPFTVTPQGGETLGLSIASGKLSFEWLPPKAQISLDGAEIPVSYSPGSLAVTGSLLAQEYELRVSMPGIGSFAERIAVAEGAETKVTRLTSFALDGLKAQRNQRRALDSGGWISLGVGLLGAAGAATSYYLGAGAMDEYKRSTISADIDAAKSMTELYGKLFTVTAVLGGAGLGLSPVLLALGPKGKSLESSMRELETQIDALRRAGQ